MKAPDVSEPETPYFESLALQFLEDGYIGAFSSLATAVGDHFLTDQHVPNESQQALLRSPALLKQAGALLVELEKTALEENAIFQPTRALALFYMDIAPELAEPYATRALYLAHSDDEKRMSHSTLGDVLINLGNLEKAFYHYNEALPNEEALKKWVATSLQLGQERERRGQWADAVQLYKDTLAKTSDPLLILRLGLAELSLNKLDDAKQHLELFTSKEAPQCTLEPGPAYIALAQAYEKGQEFPKAIECLYTYLHHSPATHPEQKTHAAVHLAHLLNRLNRCNEAERVLESAQRTDAACVQLGIARGTQQISNFLAQLERSPKDILQFLAQLESKA